MRSSGQLLCLAVVLLPLCGAAEAQFKTAGIETRQLNICNPDCQNGTCTGPNVCICKPGYIEHETLPHVCEPLCMKGCDNGFCSDPDFCTCYTGFIKHVTQSHICVPICPQGCKNGYCTWPDLCKCYPNFQEVSDGVCEPSR